MSGPRPAADPYSSYLIQALAEQGPNADERLPFLLTLYSGSSRRRSEAIQAIESYVHDHARAMSSESRGAALAALVLLRGLAAPSVPIARRLAWVKETVRIADDAVATHNGFLANWATGLFLAQTPRVLGHHDRAKLHLQWCLAHAHLESTPGLLREAARVHHALEFGGPVVANTLQIGPLTTSLDHGSSFYPRAEVVEVAPSVWVARGYGYADFYFVELPSGGYIGIDGGTRPDRYREGLDAYRRLRNRTAPPSAVFITHAHWDHVGGTPALRELRPEPETWAHAQYKSTAKRASDHELRHRWFRSERFENSWVQEFAPDHAVQGPTAVSFPGATFDLVPLPGGETEDALAIHWREGDVVFVGDFLMPYFGDTFAAEGDTDGVIDAVGMVTRLGAKHVLHGHYGLTENFSAEALPGVEAGLREYRAWVDGALAQGRDRPSLLRENFYPRAATEHPAATVALLTLREGYVTRRFATRTGVWGRDHEGITGLGQEDRARIVQALGGGPRRVANAIDRLVDAGDLEAAVELALWVKTAYGNDPRVALAVERAHRELAERHQFLSPFRFFLHSELANRPVLPYVHPSGTPPK